MHMQRKNSRSQKNHKQLRTKTSPIIIGTGLIALDVVIQGNEYQLSQRWAGGSCGNVLIVLSYFGWNAYPVSRLNGEMASRRVLRDLKRWKVQLDFAKSVPRVNTPIIIQKILSDGSAKGTHKFSSKCPNCNSWLPTYRPITAACAQRVAQRVEDPRVFFFDRVSRGSLMLAKTSSDKGAMVVFEPSGVGDPKLFREAVDVAHIIKYSKERMGNALPTSAANHVLLEIETLGSSGLRYRSNLPRAATTGWQHIDAFKITNVKDTAGAGDWCTAGVIHMLGSEGLAGFKKTTPKTLENSIRFGQALAAWTCQFEGARGGMYEVNRRTFEASIADLISQVERPKLRLTSKSPMSLILRARGHNESDNKSSRTRLIRVAALAPSQDACCF